MTGVHHVEVKNRDARFKFDLYRNITVVRGNSGTGKTTLFEMIADYTRLKEASGVNLSCDKDCVALTDTDWKNQLSGVTDSIVFIDEGAVYLRSKDFAKAIKRTDNYYVIFSRENLHELPYSVEEIYEIRASGKFHSFKKMYRSEKHIYYKDGSRSKPKPDAPFHALLTEDSRSGYRFYCAFFRDDGVECHTSGSNSAIFHWLNEHRDEKVFVIADGAAFGSEIDRILKLRSAENFRLCLPESFEWLILKSGLIKTEDIADLLDRPSDFIESADFFSWENFFEKYLTDHTVGTPFQYSKSELNPTYLNRANAERIIGEIFQN
ncbi:MAG: hypothetical protein NC084_04540 [Bacteroides sp.]|nr:translation initiation factor 2 [Eubacterium sp.]MCM1418665.1 translation initiation factor 2 [Roseburia sp.]MCM1461966.1 hypothetical protein [Bacteroides sp.]